MSFLPTELQSKHCGEILWERRAFRRTIATQYGYRRINTVPLCGDPPPVAVDFSPSRASDAFVKSRLRKK